MSQDQIHDSNTIPFTMIPHEVVRDNATFGDIYEKMVYFVLKSHAADDGRHGDGASIGSYRDMEVDDFEPSRQQTVKNGISGCLRSSHQAIRLTSIWDQEN